jgi:hypothetical protein
MADIDRARLIEIATAMRRAARQPMLIELCDGAIALATAKPIAASHVTATSSAVSHVTDCPACAARRKLDADRQKRRRDRTAEKPTIGTAAI